MSAPLCHAVGSPSPTCPSCGYGVERRALDRASRAYASQYVGEDGLPVYGAFTLTDDRASAWLVTGSLSEARTVAYLHNLAYGFTS